MTHIAAVQPACDRPGRLQPEHPPTQVAARWSWDDIRFFVAAARSGSTLAASKLLAVSQTTVARRIDHLEQQVGRRLFERRQGGYRLTAAGLEAAQAAEGVRANVLDFLALFPPGEPPLTGRLRITTEPEFASPLVLPALERVRLGAPDVLWTVLVHDRPTDLLTGQADVRIGRDRLGGGVGLYHRRLGGSARQNAGTLWLSYTGRRVSPTLARLLAETVEAELSLANRAAA
jgi:DNA-binding transcriptional LysR family regulator